ncbi:hypothetical protein C0992_007946 [Termitomyces sp. T32_za158]|nr:hypothetical protein C0992_007946 [Termitomyces sp. T32_za158]
MMSKTEVNTLEASLSTARLMLTMANSDQAQLSIQTHIDDLRHKMSRAEDQVLTLTVSLSTMQQKFLQPYPHLESITSTSAAAILSVNNHSSAGPSQVSNAQPASLSRKRTHDDLNTSSSTENVEPIGPQIQVDAEMSDEEMGMVEEEQVGRQILHDLSIPETGPTLTHIRFPMLTQHLYLLIPSLSLMLQVITALPKIGVSNTQGDFSHFSAHGHPFCHLQNPFQNPLPCIFLTFSLCFLPQNFLHSHLGALQPLMTRGKLRLYYDFPLILFLIFNPSCTTIPRPPAKVRWMICICLLLTLRKLLTPTLVPPALQSLIYSTCLVPILMCLPFISCVAKTLADVICRTEVPSSPRLRQTTILLILLILISASEASTPFKTIALNANGMADPIKIHNIQTIIRDSEPHAFVIGETKSTQKVSQRLQLPGYCIFESPGKPSGSQRGKWGVIVGVRNNISAAYPISLDPSMDGRAVALDLVIPTSAGKGFPH